MRIINLKYCTALLLIVFIAASCRKVISLDLGNNTGQVVIEGNITNEPGTQYVKLSRNVPFTSTNTYPAVTGATVIFDNNHGKRYALTEGPSGTYALDNAYGTIGRTYTLIVTADGKTYTANSTMPAVTVLDSISSKSSIFESSKNKRQITVFFQDPPEVSNQYRFVLFVNKVQAKSIFAFDDEFINGKYVNLDLQQNDTDIYPGDTVTVEMQCIDKPIYTYWYTLMQQQAGNPGGSVAPANPPTNITPATLGYFSAHTTQRITLEVK
ncbi:MAG: hypothetical protein JWP78_1987 [Mucilaginibacter sp.]|nr:hypothetical protein [Mucilaginibacter sp.]